MALSSPILSQSGGKHQKTAKKLALFWNFRGKVGEMVQITHINGL